MTKAEFIAQMLAIVERHSLAVAKANDAQQAVYEANRTAGVVGIGCALRLHALALRELADAIDAQAHWLAS